MRLPPLTSPGCRRRSDPLAGGCSRQIRPFLQTLHGHHLDRHLDHLWTCSGNDLTYGSASENKENTMVAYLAGACAVYKVTTRFRTPPREIYKVVADETALATRHHQPLTFTLEQLVVVFVSTSSYTTFRSHNGQDFGRRMFIFLRVVTPYLI